MSRISDVAVPQKVGLAQLIGSPFFGQSEQVLVSTAENDSCLRILGFAPDSLVELHSYPDARLAEPCYSPNLVHGTTIQKLNLSGGSSSEWATICKSESARERADGLIVTLGGATAVGGSNDLNRLNHLNLLGNPVRIGMRTADCLTWVCCLKAGTRTTVAISHLGWRGYTAALHWHMAKEIQDLVQRGGDWSAAWHYLGPSVFGTDYPCDDRDVGVALRDLDGFIPSVSGGDWFERSVLRRNESECRRIREQLAGFKGPKCYPDLQLLVLVDLLCLGAAADRVIVHRVNTATSPYYPSYRHRAAKPFEDGRKRLATVCSFPVLDSPGYTE